MIKRHYYLSGMLILLTVALTVVVGFVIRSYAGKGNTKVCCMCTCETLGGSMTLPQPSGGNCASYSGKSGTWTLNATEPNVPHPTQSCSNVDQCSAQIVSSGCYDSFQQN